MRISHICFEHSLGNHTVVLIRSKHEALGHAMQFYDATHTFNIGERMAHSMKPGGKWHTSLETSDSDSVLSQWTG